MLHLHIAGRPNIEISENHLLRACELVSNYPERDYRFRVDAFGTLRTKRLAEGDEGRWREAGRFYSRAQYNEGEKEDARNRFVE